MIVDLKPPNLNQIDFLRHERGLITSVMQPEPTHSTPVRDTKSSFDLQISSIIKKIPSEREGTGDKNAGSPLSTPNDHYIVIFNQLLN